LKQPFDKQRNCPVLVTIGAMGGKWKTRILWHLREGPARFGDLARVLSVSEKVLTENLKLLEREGIIARTEVTSGNAISVEYMYTPYGRSLVPVLDAMGQWGIAHWMKAENSRI
jgi:DNA-binding HxlR family transcriptional regulator